MPKKKANTNKKRKELSEKDKLILSKVKEDPEKPLNQIGKELVELGVYKHPGSIYRRLSQNGILKREIAEVEKYWGEHLKREIYPLAAKRWKRALKNKDLSDKEAFSFVKLAADKVHADTTHVEFPPQVNFAVIHALMKDLLPLPPKARQGQAQSD
jgi:hypothetical protein